MRGFRGAKDERGGVLVRAAVSIPVFLLFCGLIIDVGNWYTHKRQLQNRADAGVLAAGRVPLAAQRVPYAVVTGGR